MKILQIGKFYYPVQGGVESLLKQLSEYLAERVDLQVAVASEDSKQKKTCVDGIKVLRMSSLGKIMSTSIVPGMIRLLKNTKADIIHYHLPNPMAVMAWHIAKPKAYSVVSWHSDIIKQKIARFIYQPFENEFLSAVDKILVATPNHIKYSNVLRDYQDKCRILPFGVKLEEFRRTAEIDEKVEILREKYPQPLFLFVGRFVYYKGLEYLIKAFQSVRGNLIIIGDGPLKLELSNLIKNTGQMNKIHILDNIHGQEALLPYLHACDCFVLPSVERSEAFAIVQIEAFACGKPVISTNLKSGVPWVNHEGHTGLIVPPKDIVALSGAMRKIADNPELGFKLGQNGKRRTQKLFRTEKWCENNLKIYKEIFGIKQ